MRALMLFLCMLLARAALAQTESEEIYLLAEPEEFPEQHKELLTAAVHFVVERNFEAKDFQVTINECNAEWCQVFLSPVDVNWGDDSSVWAVCPKVYCASMRYIFRSSSFSYIVGIR